MKNKILAGGVIGVIFTACIAALLALNAWIVMLIWGALAHAFGFRTISFWVAVLICLALSAVGGFFKGSTNNGS